MVLSLSGISGRVQDEGKDGQNRHNVTRENYVQDTCAEICTSPIYDFDFLHETITITIPATKTDWINLGSTDIEVEIVSYSGSVQGRNNFEFLSEENFVQQNYDINSSVLSYYRIRWDTSTKLYQISFINGPESGKLLNVKVKKFFTDPANFPDYMEEVLVLGSLYRFLAFLEGEDLPLAILKRSEYYNRLDELTVSNNQRGSNKPRRSKTMAEIRRERRNNYGFST